MASYKPFGEIEISFETRLCRVKDNVGYFHRWEQWSDVINASPLAGGHPGGRIERVYGIVEFTDGVKRIDPVDIVFMDDTHELLSGFQRQYEMTKNE